MILPDKEFALEIAKDHLAPEGKIYFMLTLYKEKKFIYTLIGYIKPYIKYLTTMDYGRITYENEFKELAES